MSQNKEIESPLSIAGTPIKTATSESPVPISPSLAGVNSDIKKINKWEDTFTKAAQQFNANYMVRLVIVEKEDCLKEPKPGTPVNIAERHAHFARAKNILNLTEIDKPYKRNLASFFGMPTMDMVGKQPTGRACISIVPYSPTSYVSLPDLAMHLQNAGLFVSLLTAVESMENMVFALRAKDVPDDERLAARLHYERSILNASDAIERVQGTILPVFILDRKIMSETDGFQEHMLFGLIGKYATELTEAVMNSMNLGGRPVLYFRKVMKPVLGIPPVTWTAHDGSQFNAISCADITVTLRVNIAGFDSSEFEHDDQMGMEMLRSVLGKGISVKRNDYSPGNIGDGGQEEIDCRWRDRRWTQARHAQEVGSGPRARMATGGRDGSAGGLAVERRLDGAGKVAGLRRADRSAVAGQLGAGRMADGGSQEAAAAGGGGGGGGGVCEASSV
jgi:hypothetical protein